MVRMIIVDDKPRERDGLQKAIDWGDLGVRVTGVYANGRLALDAIAMSPPEIVLSDIVMPVMNGIELAEVLHAQYPKVRILFMSCHSDFGYAKSAVELGISRYVLKPIDFDELKRAVGRIVQELAMEEMQERELQKVREDSRASLTLAREQFLKELLLGNYASREDVVGHMTLVDLSIPECCAVQVATLALGRQESDKEAPAPAGYIVSYAVKEIVLRYATAHLALHPVQTSEKRFALLAIPFGPADDDRPSATVPGLLDALSGIHEEIGRKLGLLLKIGVSRTSRDPMQLPSLLTEAESAMESAFFSESDPIVMYEDIAGLEHRPVMTGTDIDQIYQEFRAVLSTGTDGELDHFLDARLRGEGQPTSEEHARNLAFTLLNMASMMLIESGRSLQDAFGEETDFWKRIGRTGTVESLKTCLASAILPIRDALWGRPESNSSRIVASIKEMIHHHYREPVKVDDIARTVYLSARYCNSLFKRETGRTVFDYLVDCRIGAAMKLLKEPGSKVTAVAEQVGYENASYFCLLFKKHTGLTPAEFKIRGIPR